MQILEKMREYDGDKQELVMTLVASPEEVDESAKSFFDDLQKREHKGFRKGKTPRAVLEQSVGGHANAMGGVAEVLVNDKAVPAIDAEGVIFLEEPHFNIDGMIEEGKPFTFSVSGPVAPIMKLTDYGPVSIEMPPEEATDAEMEEQFRALQDVYHHFENIDDPDHEADYGDYVMTTMTITDSEGKVVNRLSAVSRMIGLGTGAMPESFDAKLIGAKAGETREFDFEAIKEDGTSDFGEGVLHAVVDIKNFRKKILPELDDELAVKVGCMDVDDMVKQMRRSINVQKKRDLPKVKVDKVIEKVIERLDGEVPQYYVDFFREDVGREFMQDLENKGTNLQEWMIHNSIEGEKMKEEIAKESLHRASIDCALDALFTEKEMEVTEDYIREMFSEGDDGEDAFDAWKDANRTAELYKIARQQLATDWLVETADVTVIDYSAEAAKEAEVKKQSEKAAKKPSAKKTSKGAKASNKDDDVLEISFSDDSVKLDIE